MKIANIDREVLHNFWATQGVWMKFSGKDVTYGNIESHKKPGFHPFFRRYIFWKTTGASNWPPAVLGLTLKQIFWKTKTFTQKLEYRFLVDSIKIENASFPYKTVILENNVKTNRMVSTKWTFHKEQSFTSNYFIFLKIFFQFKNLL